jgi:hypothetical protein
MLVFLLDEYPYERNRSAFRRFDHLLGLRSSARPCFLLAYRYGDKAEHSFSDVLVAVAACFAIYSLLSLRNG